MLVFKHRTAHLEFKLYNSTQLTDVSECKRTLSSSTCMLQQYLAIKIKLQNQEEPNLMQQNLQDPEVRQEPFIIILLILSAISYYTKIFCRCSEYNKETTKTKERGGSKTQTVFNSVCSLQQSVLCTHNHSSFLSLLSQNLNQIQPEGGLIRLFYIQGTTTWSH